MANTNEIIHALMRYTYKQNHDLNQLRFFLSFVFLAQQEASKKNYHLGKLYRFVVQVGVNYY